MKWLGARLQLDPPTLDALWLLICAELDPAVAQLVNALGLTAMNVMQWRRLAPSSFAAIGTMRDLGLIELAGDPSVPQHLRPVRASDRVIELALGEVRLDEEIARCTAVVGASGESIFSHAVGPIADAVLGGTQLIVAVGAEGSGRATLLQHVARSLGTRVLEIDCRKLAPDSSTLTRQLRAIERECLLLGLIPLFREADTAKGLFALIDAYVGTIFATAAEPVSSKRSTLVHEMACPDAEGRSRLWQQTLGAAAPQALLAAVSEQYRLRPGAIVAAARNARAASSTLSAEVIHAGLRAHLGEQLGASARRIEVTQRWDDLVLPAEQFDQIAELIARVRQRRQVLESWGFARKIGKGTGITALLSGPPGTGKTMVAGLVARELGLDLYQVDLSRIVSKYIGETEKQLGRLFDAAESGQALVLFDEADSLFAKRTEVKSSNDRYANLEVNYLLQRIESFHGIALLTTNHEASIDPAFRRRIAIDIRFPLPEESQRAELWKALMPAEANVAPDVDFTRLARDYEMTGGYVKNAVLRAAFMAADAAHPISMHHLWHAARLEYEAMGKIVRV